MGPIGHSLAALALLAAAPPVALAMLLRPELRSGLPERFGFVPPATPDTEGAIWVHASSVGEAKAACRLVDALGLGSQDGVVRCSAVHYNTVQEVDRLVTALDSVL